MPVLPRPLSDAFRGRGRADAKLLSAPGPGCAERKAPRAFGPASVDRHSAPGRPSGTVLNDLAQGLRYTWGLPRFLRQSTSVTEARAALPRRFEQRCAVFLDFVRRAVYLNPRSPYRELLATAGCEWGDLIQLVRQEGIEGALAVLFRSGVHLTVDEFKGRRPVRRGGLTMAVSPARVRNPFVSAHLWGHTSGSWGPRTPIPIDFAWLRERAVNMSLLLDARGGRHVAHATWGTPGAGLGHLRTAAVGLAQERWFWNLDPVADRLHPRHRWGYRALRLGCAWARYPLPRPEFVPSRDPGPILHWLSAVLRGGRRPNLFSFVSPALRLCQAAAESGLDLTGARFTVTGEPLTPARLAVFRRVGADVVLTYGSMEAGGDVAESCLEPAAPDDVHVLHDLYALIQPGADGGPTGLPERALLVSTLRPASPFVLLNVSLGDQAELTRRACGCALERLGWTRHLLSIRSYEKLTAGGMTLLDTDVIRVLEEVLPARFGGGPTDYQLVEDEGPDGAARVRLLVHPRVGALAEQEAVDLLLSAIARGSGGRVTALSWRRGDLVRVERRAPLTTASGKVLHLIPARPGSPVSSPAP